jgi:hypothetical protein
MLISFAVDRHAKLPISALLPPFGASLHLAFVLSKTILNLTDFMCIFMS